MKKAVTFQIIFTIAIIFFVGLNSIFAKENWAKIETTHFKIVGNADEKDLKNIAGKLENFHNNFQNSFADLKFQTPFTTNVLIFKDNDQLAKIQKDSKPFIFSDDANYITISADKNQDFTEILHDYARFLINNNLGQRHLPAWLNEGIAQYFAADSTDNLLASQPNNVIPFNLFLETDYYTLAKQNSERKTLFTAQSLALVQFLINKKGDGKFENIAKLVQLLRNEKDDREALINIFQINFSTLDKEFSQFILQANSQFKPNFETPKLDNFAVNKISEAESLASLGEYFYYADRPKEAAEILSKSLQVELFNSLALTTLALIKANGFYYDEAEKLAQSAVDNEPDNFLNHYRYAKVLSRRGMTEFGFVSGYNLDSAEKMRAAVSQSITLNPTFTASYALLAFVNYVRNEELEIGIESIKKALAIVPENQQYLIRLAELNLRKENFIQARKVSLDILRSTESERLRLYAQNTLQRIDTTEFQLNRIRNEKTKYVNDDIVTEKPLNDEEIKRLREKATSDQIRAILRRPKMLETRMLASLTKIECGQEKIEFVFNSPTGLIRLQAKSFDGVSLISFIEEMADFRLNCGNIKRENNASVIYGKENNVNKIVSIEFVPKGFVLKN